MENFIGKDGFVWWYGVVEDTNDPAKLGRCRVRIFGWHTDNLQQLPTTDLPWAQPLNPANNSKTFSPPRLGDYVMGFFSDGVSAQAPVLLGVFPGLDSSPDKTKGFSPQSKLTPAQPPSGQVQYTTGQPTVAPLGRGVVANTAISQANDNLAHVCDISAEVKFEIAKATISITSAITAIRTEIEGLWASTSTSPFADEVRNEATTIKNKINELKKFINDQTEPLKDIQKYVKDLQDLIVYIDTLPARIASQLRQCLSDATNGISEAVALGTSVQQQVQSGAIAKANIDVVLQEAIASNPQNEIIIAQKP